MRANYEVKVLPAGVVDLNGERRSRQPNCTQKAALPQPRHASRERAAGVRYPTAGAMNVARLSHAEWANLRIE
jgi:hypothetical protein